MSVSKKDVLHIAGLSKLNISDEEIDDLTAELEKIIGFAGMLSELHDENIVQESGAMPQNVFREDVITQSYNTDILLENAPHSRDGYYLAPDMKRRDSNGDI